MSSSPCKDQSPLREVFLTNCLNGGDYYCLEENRGGDHCTSPSYKIYDKKALEEFYEDISFCLDEKPINLNCLKPFINSFQLALYPPKILKNSENSEKFYVLDKVDLMCGQSEQLTTLIEKIQNSDTTDTRLKTLLLTKLNLFVKKIQTICNEKKGGRRHTKKRNRKQKKTRRSLRSYRY